jgi:hypothetical protein
VPFHPCPKWLQVLQKGHNSSGKIRKNQKKISQAPIPLIDPFSLKCQKLSQENQWITCKFKKSSEIKCFDTTHKLDNFL